MPTIEEATPLDAAPTPVAPERDGAAANAPKAAADAAHPEVEAPPSATDTLSPAVRRLVRQFDLDITAIHGTGPDGRIRVGDVMDLLGGRTDSGNRDALTARTLSSDSDGDAPDEAGSATSPAVASPPAPAASVAAGPTTTVFDCDLSRVSSHRKKLRRDNVELLTTSYFLVAFAAALDDAPELTAEHAACFGVSLTTAEGEAWTSFFHAPDPASADSLDERLRQCDVELRANLDSGSARVNLLVHHYGESGSLLAMPTPIGAGLAASVGIGRVRREIVVRTIEGVETPRVAARCYVSLSFLADRISLARANRFLAHAVRVLEQWPETGDGEASSPPT